MNFDLLEFNLNRMNLNRMNRNEMGRFDQLDKSWLILVINGV